jgi:hypothetical protein
MESATKMRNRRPQPGTVQIYQGVIFDDRSCKFTISVIFIDRLWDVVANFYHLFC